jgi:hypothetical protein
LTTANPDYIPVTGKRAARAVAESTPRPAANEGDESMLSLLPPIEDILTRTPVLLIPLWQVLAFVTVISIAAVFERHRLVLVLSYTFAVYWVFVENLKLLSLNRISALTVGVFLLFGLAGLCLTLYQMLTSKS